MRETPDKPEFASDFRRFFLRGLAALVPTLATIAILIWVYRFVRDNVAVHITHGLLLLCSAVSPQPATGFVDPAVDPIKYGMPLNEWNDAGQRITVQHKIIHHIALEHSDRRIREAAARAKSDALWEIAFTKYRLHLVGLLIAVILVYFTGFLLASFLGRQSWRAAESLLYRVPLIRAIYPHVKQVTDFVLSERKVDFSGVVAVEYPRKGVWSVGLRTGAPMSQVQDSVGETLITVFIPSSPTPITGYVVQVPKKDVIELGISIDEGFRFTISGGVIKPGAILDADRDETEG